MALTYNLNTTPLWDFTSTTDNSGASTASFGDIDGDGDLDLFVGVERAGGSQGSMVFKNDGSGNFTKTQTFSAMRVVRSFLVNIDGDADLELITRSLDAPISIFENNGSGTFSLASTTSANVNDVAVGDLDGDGDVDMFIALKNGNYQVYKNNGTGTFTISSTPASSSTPLAVALADLDKDGDLDVVSYEENNGRILLNNGSGAFSSGSTFGDVYGSTAISADVTGDGYADILTNALGSGNGLNLYQNNGSGGLGTLIQNFSGGAPYRFADVDSDGDLDGFSGDLYLNNGSGTLTAAGKTFQDPTFLQYSVPVDGTVLGAGDVDGDGDKDLVVAFYASEMFPAYSYSSRVSVFINNSAPPANADGTLTAGTMVTEPVSLATTIDTAGEAIDVFDFKLTDGGTSDGLALGVSQLVLHTSGTGDFSKVVWRLNGPDATNVAGTYNNAAHTLTFSGLTLSVANGGNETYRVNAYYSNNTSLTEGQTYILSIDGDTDVTVSAGGTTMAAGQSAITNSTGSTVNVVATQLAVVTQPAGSTSGSPLTTQMVVKAVDAFGNLDIGFTGNVTLSENDPGTLSGTLTVAAVGGIATFTDVTYTTNTNGEIFQLDASATGLTGVTSANVTTLVLNITPTIGLDNSNLGYTENASPIQIDASGTVNDADGDADWNAGKLEIQITSGNIATDQISISDTDGDGTAITISGTDIFANGTDVGDLSASGGVVTNGTKLTITFDSDATNAIVQETLQSIRYQNTGDDPGSTNRVVTVTATDKNSGSASDTRTIAITPVNDAPVVTPATPSMTSITEDNTTNGGQTVLSIVGASITDVDSGAAKGMAITSLTSGTGTWQYSTDNGGTWTAVGAVASDSALLLRDTDKVRFVPNGQNGTSASLTYRAWDQTSGTAGNMVDTSANGGTTAFSTSMDTASITVTSVNDAPVLTPATPTLTTITEDDTTNAGQTVASIIGASITDVDSGAVEGIAITGLTSGNGAWEYSTNNGGSWAAIGAVAGNSSLLLRDTDKVRFVPNGADGTSASFTYRAWDQGSGSAGSKVDTTTNGGTTAFSTATDTASITVSAINDAPTMSSTGSNPTYLPGGPASTIFSGTSISTIEAGQNITGTTLTVTNVTDGASEGLLIDGTTVALTNGSSGTSATNSFGYSVSVSGSTATITLTKTDTSANWQTLVNGLKYQNTSSNPTIGSDRIVTITSVKDDGGTANGGADTAILSVGSTVSFGLPSITSATYDWSTGQLALTGNNFVAASGANNDVIANLLNITGEDGASYTLGDTANVEITSSTSATLNLSETDKLNVHGLLNKNGTTSSSATTYNLEVSDNWLAGSPTGLDISDATGNGITVSNVATPTITSATYDSDSGIMQITGTNLFKKVDIANDIDISTLTLTGGTANDTYTLTSANDVEITSSTSFTVTLIGIDKTNVDALLDQVGTVSSGGSTYNLAAADNWLAAAESAADISDATNAVTVSIAPKVTSATYDALTGSLVVTGTNIQAKAGAANDIDASKFTLTGEGGATYTLTDTPDVELSSATQFTLALSATDMAALNQILNKNGTSSTGNTTYNLAAADDWDTNVIADDTSDATGNGITVSNVAVPTITSAAYNVSTSVLTATGTGFLKLSGATNDIDVSKLTLTGDGGATYTLTTTSIEITSATSFSVTLNGADQTALKQIINSNGTASTGGTTYNLAAAEDWAAGANSSVNVADLAGNGITVSNVPAPAITSAAYNSGTGALVVTGTDFLKLNGAANDIVANKFIFTGEAGATYTLTDTANVEITSETQFTLTLSSTDKTEVNQILNKNGTASNDNTTYNIAAAEDWAAGANAAVNVADLLLNGITVTLNQPPVITSSGGGATAAINTVENTTAITTVTATDANVGQTVTFSLTGGADQSRFQINAASGSLSFINAPDFESPTDNGANNTYEVIVQANDGNGGVDSQSITVTVTDAVENVIPPDPPQPPAPNPAPVIPPASDWGNLPDNDNDGVPEVVEGYVPGLTGGVTGDGNGDGVQDQLQSGVSSVPFLNTSTPVSDPGEAPQVFLTLVGGSDEGKIDSGTSPVTFKDVKQIDAPANLPENVEMPLGMISFTADIETPGSSENFSIFVDENIAINGYWKQNQEGAWVNLASPEYGGQIVTEGGKTRLDFAILDGGEFDNDGEADGVITDPGAPGWRDIALAFDENYYLESKLQELRADGLTQYVDIRQVKGVI
ncbi:FG-GAP-like repeat-containing protein, partial [Desulforegula conservatrix]|uniref:FG-GAP-like repeat-containing protein n=1 Tax=Desulforegula conservatrix TaxID=153026 RepID=UPI0006844B9A